MGPRVMRDLEKSPSFLDGLKIFIHAKLSRNGVFALGNSTRPVAENRFGLFKRSRDDVNAHELANAAGPGRNPFSRSLSGTDVPANQHRDVTVQEVLLADQSHIGRFDHSIRCFNGSDKAERLYHS